MKTGTFRHTTSHLNNSSNFDYRKYRFTLILLCIGYFIDFYDLTIFSASYVTIIKESFHINNLVEIQKTYLLINNFFTAGIVFGSILFGIFSDKFGRISTIRYSILLYSVTTILCVFTKSLNIFIVLRFLSGIGLASEFAMSSVLISELLPPRLSTKYTSILYLCGILGGMTAIYLNSVSWQVMFLFGGFAGIILYIIRKKLVESLLFLNMNSNIHKGNLLQLINSYQNILKFVKLLFLGIPYFFLISIMLVYPKFMPLHAELAHSISVLLIGFFTGNIVSTLISSWIINKFKDFRIFLFCNIMLFSIAMPIFFLVSDEFFFVYCIILGLLGGGLPSVWIQVVLKSYGTNLRGTATSTLNGFGRLSCVGFNLLSSMFLSNSHDFIVYCIIVVVLTVFSVLIILFTTKNNYATKINFLES